ncbi:MAG TPA: hypothetical protein DCP92_09345 [Nitrospiraceae bacterium]|jgi:hypothetical protein|nr:hypothetical protein [Nitrospiraceae bacterium]
MIICFVIIVTSSSAFSFQEEGTFSYAVNFGTYEDNRLGVKFSYPLGWKTEIRCTPSDSYNCRISMEPEDWPAFVSSSDFSEPAFPLNITATDKRFEEAADSAGFKRRDDKWIILGTHGMEGETQEITGKNCKGIIGEATVSIYKKNGEYYAVGHETRAVLGDGVNRSVIIACVANACEVIDKVISSFEFIEKQ